MPVSEAADRARQALLQDSRQEEAITVNQRALIDKILARYAAEFTVFRELLQNADDAGATHCELRFESQNKASQQQPPPPDTQTVPLVPDLKATLQNWVFRNDGKPFGSDDWSRLRRIAEGNPDPDRIGAFGVGFYSLFSICEEPIVSSGQELMGFFWKQDALFTRRAQNVTEDRSPSGNPWTTFFMSLREPAPFPDSPLALSKFLATSLTFTTNVRTINLYWDDQPLCKLQKKLGTPKSMNMPSHLNSYSPAKIMKVRDLESTAVQIDVEAMQLVISLAEADKPKSKISLTAAFGKTAGSGLTSMLQSAFGFSSKDKEKEREREKEKERDRQSEAEPNQATSAAASLLTTLSASIHLRIATANINVSADKAFQREIERSTKKPPPKTTAFHIIFTGNEEYEASFPPENHQDPDEKSSSSSNSPPSNRASLDSGVRQIFQGLMPKLEEQGHVFIGFRTHQTSGFSGHVAARFIPTVERESLDFIDRYCAIWNSELLSMGGYIARAVYENELYDVGRIWDSQVGAARPADDNQDAKRLKHRALHTMRFFTFRTSSPSNRVSSLFETSFFGSSRQNTISIMSTRGVKHSAAVRIPNALLAEFVKDLAVIPPHHVDQAADFVREVKARNLVHDISMDDVFKELAARALTPQEMVACLKWWVTVAAHPSYNISLRDKLLSNGILSVAASEDGKIAEQIQPLALVHHYLNTQRLPTDVPLPDTCLSHQVSKSLTAVELSKVFGWTELTVPVWLSHIVRISNATSTPIEDNIQLSPTFSEKILGILSRAWFALPGPHQAEINQMLQNVACVPTRKAMQKPGDAYFANVSLFPDLPIIEFPSAQIKGNLEKLLIALGVRRHVELQMIFNRLVAAGDWSHVDLVVYLASNKDSLTALEKERLKKTPIFPKQGEVALPNKDGKSKIVRFRASELYEPTEALKALKLPVLDWTSKPWKSTSDEAKFIFELGLQRYPPLEEVLSLASNTADDHLRAKALDYLIDKFTTVYASQYSLSKAAPFAFVPSKTADGKKGLNKPTEVFTNSEASVMGWPVVSPELNPTDIPKLELRANPTGSQLVGRLLNNPTKDEALARKIFEYLSTVNELSLNDYGLLKTAELIPVKQQRPAQGDKGAQEEIVLVAPINCYFGSTSSTPQFKDVFSYCDFGPAAGAFLRNCGVRNEPSIEEVAERLVAEPGRFYRLAGNTDAYLGILRQVATNWDRIRSPLRSAMKRSAFLLGSKRLRHEKKNEKATDKIPNLMDNDEEEEEDENENEDPGMLVYELKRPSEVVIVDDANSHMLFGSSCFFAPHEDLLQEGLYEQLGSPRLSSLVDELYSTEGQLLPDTRRANDVKTLILERTPLFLFEKRLTAKNEIRKDSEWLKSALEVVEVDRGGLRLTRTLRFGHVQEVNVQKCSAMASLRGSKLTLFLSASLEVDYFEVAMALNKHLLTRQRLQEVLLYMTLLSSSLKNLKRKGFHVDKILAQRKAQKEAAETRLREQRIQAELDAARAQPSEADFAGWQKQLLDRFPDAEPTHVAQALRSHQDNHLDRTTQNMLQEAYVGKSKGEERSSSAGPSSGSGLNQAELVPPPSLMASGGGLFSRFKSRLLQPTRPSSLADETSSIVDQGGMGGGGGGGGGPFIPGGWGGLSPGSPPAITASGRSEKSPAVATNPAAITPTAGLKPAGFPSRPDTSEVTPMSTIHSNVVRAIQASRPDHSSAIQTQATTNTIKEASNSYCDQAAETDLRLAGQISSMKIYLHSSLDASAFLQNNAAALDRLINHVYKPVGAIFGLDPRSLHVFCDTQGPRVAFNRGGSIFLNFRYYLAWHDGHVEKGKMAEPLVSTYFSVAHEIAHNVIIPHNAEHEWYFSAIAEKYIVALVEYIGKVDGLSS